MEENQEAEMSIFNIFKQPPPPPKPWYKNVAMIAIVLTVFSMVTLGPIGVIYNGMTEEIKKLDTEKASRDTIQQMLKNQELLIKQNNKDGVKRDRVIEKNQEAIQQKIS